jgi:putative flippase GtrA
VKRRPILRFALVGIANTAIDLAAFALFLLLFPPIVSNILAWSCAVVFSYAVNSQWTFENSHRSGKAFLRFVAAGALASLIVSTLTLMLLGGVVGIWPAKAIAIVLAFAVSFAGSRWALTRGQ